MTGRCLVALLFLLVPGCGDDEKLGPDAPPAGTDARVCPGVPMIVDRGPPAPDDLGIDPQGFDNGVVATFDPMAIADDPAFLLSPTAGAMTGASFIAWGKATPGLATRLRVWRAGPNPGEVVLVEDRAVTTDVAGFAKETVTGLAPATFYSYAWFTGGAPFTGRSRIGRVLTAFPPGGLAKLDVAATTCIGSANPVSRAVVAPFPALGAMAAGMPDLVINVGDASYNDLQMDLAGYRAEWQRSRNEQGYRDLDVAAGSYQTWDDHEVTDNWNPETIAPARLAAATQAYFENTPTERGPNDRLWRSYQWGDTVEIIITDLRSERLPSTLGTPGAHFVSAAQLAFIQDRLQNTTATFKLVFSSVNMTDMAEPWDVPLSLDDRWEGYEPQRSVLLDFIVDNSIRNVFFIAGDIHMGFVGRIAPPGHRHSKMWELTVGPGAAEANPIGTFLETADPDVRNNFFPCDQFPFFHGRIQVATTLALDPGTETIHIVYTDVTTAEVLFDQVLQQED